MQLQRKVIANVPNQISSNYVNTFFKASTSLLRKKDTDDEEDDGGDGS